ncbi:hypothetical protein ACTXT7_017578, partial [Hymenolepis weldensis]
GLRSPCYAEIRQKLLPLLDKNPDIMLHHLVDEYNNFRSLITDSILVESNETRKPEIDRLPENNPTPQPQLQPQRQHTYSNNNKPRGQFCGDFHFYKDCPFYKHQYQDCHSYGHKQQSTVCYVADRDINLLGLDWVDMFNVLEPKVQSVTCPQ